MNGIKVVVPPPTHQYALPRMIDNPLQILLYYSDEELNLI